MYGGTYNLYQVISTFLWHDPTICAMLVYGSVSQTFSNADRYSAGDRSLGNTGIWYMHGFQYEISLGITDLS